MDLKLIIYNILNEFLNTNLEFKLDLLNSTESVINTLAPPHTTLLICLYIYMYVHCVFFPLPKEKKLVHHHGFPSRTKTSHNWVHKWDLEEWHNLMVIDVSRNPMRVGRVRLLCGSVQESHAGAKGSHVWSLQGVV